MFKYLLIFSLIFCLNLSGSSSGKILAKQYNLYAGTKVKRQWNRIFSKPRKLIKLKLHKLTEVEKEHLKSYLINHAADSAQPEKAGI
ncbi:MAG: hypothetical protein OIF32_08670 [Campylobacterales bacterium]|nr:hypothetical protein [Campylobacterales bacterium]